MFGTGLPSAVAVLAAVAVVAYDRLPRDVHPLTYKLRLRPTMDPNFTYTGELTVEMRMNGTSELWLDADDSLELTAPSAMRFDGKWPVGHTLTRQGPRLRVVTEFPMEDSYRVELNLTFASRIRRDTKGFYLSRYTSNKTERYMASTQFESSGARLTFPCFDEPAFRANFSLEIALDPSWKAISNTPIVSDIVSGGLRRLVFDEMRHTPVYLVGWAVYEEDGYGSGPAVSVQGRGCGNVTYRVLARREYTGLGELALSAAPLLVQALENFTGITCKAVTKKMDLVAVPDFSAGAMENWGIITFRETALLFDRAYSTAWDSQQVLMIVSHELVHQWFGNLVTPDWWSYTWLSEGFARYLQYFITHQIMPTLRLDEQFLLDRRQLALEVDSPSSHPLTNEVLHTQADIEDMFDIITYDKGAAVIHMFKSVLGNENFKKGINNYLTTVDNAGGVATPDLFFSSFLWHDESGMRRWTETPGYPIIIVEEDRDSITLNQIKITGWNQTEASDWLVPISLNVDGNITWHYLMPNQTLKINLPKPTNYYFINVNQTGYYRVLYKNPSRWLTVDAGGRWSLVDDAMALAYSGLLDYRTAIGTALFHLRQDPDDYFVWSTGLKAFFKLANLLEGSDLQTNFTESILNEFLDEGYKSLTNSTSSVMKLHQMNIMRHACYYGQQDCLKAANQLSLNVSGANAERRAALLCAAVKQGNSSTWDDIWNQYLSAYTPVESQLMLRALTCTEDRQLIRRFLNFLLTSSVRRHDIVTMVSLVCSKRLGVEETFTFLKNNYTNLYNYFGEERSLRNILSAVIKQFNDTQLAELKEVVLMPQVNITSLIKSTEKSITWRKKVYQQLRAFITKETIPEEESTDSSTTGGGASNIYSKHTLATIIIIFLSVFS